MKKVRKRWNFFKPNNKGFSLVELIVAIGVLGIIVTPILSGFITSAKVNKDARQMMTTTDIAETLMEGIRNKSYKQVESCLTNIGTSASGNGILTSIDDSAFNAPSVVHTPGASEFPRLSYAVHSVSINEITLIGYYEGANRQLTFNDLSSVFEGPPAEFPEETRMVGDIAYDFICTPAGRDFNELFNADLDPENKMLTYWRDSSGLLSVVGYKNIESNGQHYDAMMIFMPAAKTGSDKYFNYYVKVNVYKTSSTGEHDLTANPIMSMTTGIKNK